MGIAAEFDAWLEALLHDYINDTTVAMALALRPVVLTLSTLYLMAWGYLMLTGRIEQPFVEGAKRIVTIGAIYAVGLEFWFYNTILVNLFFEAPAQLAARVVETVQPVTVVDKIIFDGGDAASLLMEKGELFGADILYYFAGLFVYACTGLVAIYVLFLMELSRVALSVLLGMGPLFISLLFFKTTTRLCGAWLSQLATYAFTAILTVLVATLMLGLLTTAAGEAVAVGGEITLAHAVRVGLAAGLTFLILRQIPSIAAALGGAVALGTYSAVSRAIQWSVWGTGQNTAQFTKGLLLGRKTLRSDPLSRKAGSLVRRGVGTAVVGAWRRLHPNQVSAAETASDVSGAIK
jgi:type IV secretion system protein VirB6